MEYIDSDNGIARQISRSQRTLNKLEHIEPRFAESLEMLDSIEAELSEISRNLSGVLSDIEINPNELHAKEERISELMSIARKYRIEPEELPNKLAEIQAALQQLEAAADIEALQKKRRPSARCPICKWRNSYPAHATKPPANSPPKPPNTCKRSP